MHSLGTEAQVFTGLVLAAAVKYTVSWWMRKRREKLFVKIGQVSTLYIYPVKSCKAVEVTDGECTLYGLKCNEVYDRSFMLVKPDGMFTHQRQSPKMVLISVQIKKDDIEFTAPGKPPCCIKKEANLDRKNIKRYGMFFGETIDGLDCGDEIAKWVSDYLEVEGLRVVRYVAGMGFRDVYSLSWKTWDTTAAPGDTAMYSDWAPYMMVNKASLEMLNSKMERPLTELSFRPNILIEGPEAFDEDNWLEVKIGDKVRMRCTDACTRCSLTTVLPEKGVKSTDGEPLKTLRKFRCFEQFGDSPAFGVNATPDVLGNIKVGDPVYAIKKN